MSRSTTTVYSISHPDGMFYVATQAEAIKAAREIVGSSDDRTFVGITRLTVTADLGKRELYCRLLNNEGFAVAQEEIVF